MVDRRPNRSLTTDVLQLQRIGRGEHVHLCSRTPSWPDLDDTIIAPYRPVAR
jgi:hypothetical protein